MAATKWSDSITATKAYKSSLHKVVGHNVGSLQNGSDIYFGDNKTHKSNLYKMVWFYHCNKSSLHKVVGHNVGYVGVLQNGSDIYFGDNKPHNSDLYKMVGFSHCNKESLHKVVGFLQNGSGTFSWIEVAKRPKSDLYKMDP